MRNHQDIFLYEQVESHLRDSIPDIAKNIHSNLNESSSFMQNFGLMAMEYGNKIIDKAHRLNLSANMSAKKNASRIRDELLTSHYASELGMKKKHIDTILNYYAPNHPERVSLEAKINTIGKVNPTIGALQKSSKDTVRGYADRVKQSYDKLTTPRTPLQKANIYRYLRKNPGARQIIP